ncbi:MAG: hypothetical protein WC986_13665 [Elusimicrobiota bacterium]
MRRLNALVLFLLMATGAFAQRGFTPHDCLGATAGNTITIAAGTTTYGAEVQPLGNSTDQSGFVAFSGSGTLTITIQTRRARGGWSTPTLGAEPLTAAAAGAHNFPIFTPPCDSMRLLYTASGADVEVTDAFVLEK